MNRYLLAGIMAVFGLTAQASGQTSVLATLETVPVETLRLSDFDPLDLSSAPVLFTVYLTPDAVSRVLRLEVAVHSDRFGLLGTAVKEMGVVEPGPMLVVTSRQFDSYEDLEYDSPLVEIAMTEGVLPPDAYTFDLRIIDTTSGTEEELGGDTAVIVTTNPGRQIDLVGPGTPFSMEPEQISTGYPVFDWLSDASRFDFSLFEVWPGQTTQEDVVASLPVFRTEDVQPGSFVYPNSAEVLIPGRRYAWQIQAVVTASAGDERIPSELLWFTVSDGPGGFDDVAEAFDMVRSASVSPAEYTLRPGESLTFQATAFDEEALPLYNIRPTWSVVPSAVGNVSEEGVFVAGNLPGAAAVAARYGEVEAFATVIVEPDPTAEPDVPVIVAVRAGADSTHLTLISPSDGQVLMEPAPLFAWTATGGDSVSYYQIRLSTGGDFAAADSRETIWSYAVRNATSISYPSSGPVLEPGSAFFVSVSAHDSTGAVLAASEHVAFSLEAPPKISYELYSAWDDARKSGSDTTSVRLLIRSRSEFLDPSVRQSLVGAGGTIEIVEGPWIQLSVPFNRLTDVSGLDLVELVKLPAPHVFLEETDALKELARKSDSRSDADAIRAEEPFEIAVFEFGFDEDEIRSLLPQADLSFHSFRADGRVEGGASADHVHGSAVVSAMADFVPSGARVHLINFDTEPEFHRALDYAVSRLGVRVVTCSVSWSNAYDHYDGTSYFSRRTAEILRDRTAMIVAAGNFARGHWQADFADIDGDRGHDFGNAGQLLEVRLSSNRVYNLLLSWNDWDRPSTNLDVEIYDRSGQLLHDPKGRPYASRNVQTGSRYPEPVERIRGFRPIYPGVQSYFVRVVAAEPSSATSRPNMELYVSPPPGDAAPEPDPGSSLASGLATTMSKSIIPVGAVDLDHSSQGPTNDGRTRPDFAADGTARVDGREVRGTSFAAPRVATALGLIFSKYPDWTLDEALDMLRRLSLNPAGNSKNNQTGWGRLDVDSVIDALAS